MTENHSQHLAVTLDDLIALNDEILALARSGVPLGRGLTNLAADLPDRLGKVAAEVGRHMGAGESLPQALRSLGDQIPPVYRAVVEAGIRAGRLPVALEGLARTTRRAAQLRRSVGVALLYPLLVLTLVCLLLAYVAPRAIDAMAESARSQRVADFTAADHLMPLLDSARLWIWFVPVMAITLAAGWWLRSGRAISAGSGSGPPHVFRGPWLGQLLRSGRVATFCELLGLLVEHHVPLVDGIRLAADATGDLRIRSEAGVLAEQLQRGQPPAVVAGRRPAIPPLVAATIAGGGAQVDLPAALHHAADTYYRRAENLSDWTRLYLPVLLTVSIGGVAAGVYGLLVLGPWFRFLYRLATSI